MDEQPAGGAEGPASTEDMPAQAETPQKSSGRKAVKWMAIALVALVLVAALIGGIYAWRFLSAANALTVEDVDVSRIPDGTYAGSYSLFHVKAAVEVSVEGGRITAIEFTDAGKIAEETQEEIRDIFDEVISSQSLEVDVTSGASASKKVSLKAVEEALRSGE